MLQHFARLIGRRLGIGVPPGVAGPDAMRRRASGAGGWRWARWAVSVLVIGLDLTVLNLALPTLGTDLRASTSDLQWFVDCYSLVFAAALLPAGLLGDRLGRKKVLLSALVLFGVASLACAYSHSPGELMAARVALGLAAAIQPFSVALVGMGISSVGLTSLVYGFIKAGEDGWGNVTALVTIVAGTGVLVTFVLWERRVSRRPDRQPLVELTLFGSAGFTWGAILATLVSFALFGILFAMPLYFQDVRGLDSLSAGVRLLPIIGGMVIGMVAGTRLQGPPRGSGASEPLVGARALVTAGFAVMAAALIAGTFTTVSSGAAFGAGWFAVGGVGLGLALPSALNAALGALSAERSGAGSAVVQTMRQVGATLGRGRDGCGC
jgi:MFS family permease